MIILAILLPPVAVLLATHNPVRALVNFGLTLLFWIPGMIHALMCVAEAKRAKELKQSEARMARRIGG